jgi:hypothetical protein
MGKKHGKRLYGGGFYHRKPGYCGTYCPASGTSSNNVPAADRLA